MIDKNHNGAEGGVRLEFQKNAECCIADQFLRGNNPAKNMFAEE